MNKIVLIFFWLLIFQIQLISCAQNENNIQNKQDSISLENNKVAIDKVYSKFNRDSILLRLNNKIKNSEPLVIHTFVPLCDNEHQGIVKVGGKMGDGKNLNTNLYWGAGYGLKNFFSNSKEWKYLHSDFNINPSILERAVYYRVYPNKAKVYLILDGYSGDKMYECLIDYFKSFEGVMYDTLKFGNEFIPVHSSSDFLIFNGHNGLMDGRYYEENVNEDNKERDAAIIACFSYSYFESYLIKLKAYPLLTTTNLLGPEGYIISAVIDNWAMMQSGEKIRISAGDAMSNIHKINRNACIATFKTGWDR